MKIIFIGLCFWLAGQCLATAEPISVESVRFWTGPDHTQVVFNVSGKPSYEYFVLENSDRLIIDILGARMADYFWSQKWSGGVVKNIRSGINKDDMLRIVLDLKQEARISSFTLDPKRHYGYRLVIDLSTKEEAASDNSPKIEGVNTFLPLFSKDRAVDDGIKRNIAVGILIGLIVLVLLFVSLMKIKKKGGCIICGGTKD